MAIKKKLKKLAKKVRGKVASAISAPSRAKSKLKGARATSKAKVIKTARAFGKAKTPAARKLRITAADIKRKTVKKNLKKKKK